MRLRSLPLLLLCAGLAGSLAGQNAEWHSYKNDAGNFSALMPVQPTETTNPGDGGESHTIMALTGGVGYSVVYVVSPSDQPVDEATFNIYRDSFMKGLPNCRQEKDHAASPALAAYVGHWYRLNCNVSGKAMTFAGNLYWGKRYAYAVIVIFASSPSDPPGAEHFLNSFDVLGK